jgi:prophage tail gpP-like protein
MTYAVTDPSRVTLTVNGTVYRTWMGLTLRRDLREITGTFSLQYFDAGRATQAMPGSVRPGPVPSPILRRQACTIALDGEKVLDGWIAEMEGEWNEGAIEVSLQGYDRTGDLADCAVAPNGPAEWRGATLLQVVQQICAPFGISVRAETDIGAPFARLAINPHETALCLIEKAARQRGVLVVSDGVGGLLLTSGGRAAASADIVVGGNAQRARFRFNDRRRFSDYFVKGQCEKAAGHRGSSRPPLGHDVAPNQDWQPPPASAQATEAAGILMTGHAVDPEVTRWRPHVSLTRTQSGSASAQQQAEWQARVARGESTHLSYRVLDWRAGSKRALWRPNTEVHVYDPYAGIDDVMLIRAVTYVLGPDGEKPTPPATDIEVVGLTAFDRIDEPAKRRRYHKRRALGDWE